MGELPIAVIVMLTHRNRLPDLEPFVSDVTEVLGGTLEKAVYRIAPKSDTRGWWTTGVRTVGPSPLQFSVWGC